MKNILFNDLSTYGAFNSSLPKTLIDIIGANVFNIPYRMKALIAASELVSFASQFKRNILLPEGTQVPVNSVSFCIASSGGYKDSSLRAARKIFTPAYQYINDKRAEYAINSAIAAAEKAGEDPADLPAIYSNYLQGPAAIFLKDVTPQGLVQYLNDISKEPLGAGILINSELADEFNTNPNFLDVIKIISEAYDLGIIEASYTKGKEFRNGGVSGISFNSLFIGSHYMLMYNEGIKNKLVASFMSKLSRRGSFTYVPDKVEDPVYNSSIEMVEAEKALRDTSMNLALHLSPKFIDIAKHHIPLAQNPIVMSTEADTMMILLKRYDNEISASCASESSDSLYKRNRYWRALKLAGALAIIDKSEVIQASHFAEAINITELFIHDMEQFERDLNKADHERFSDYIRTLVQADGKASISLHELKKLGFIKSTSSGKLHELVQLSAGYDHAGIYSVAPDGSSINYEVVNKTSTIGISYKPINCDDLNRAVSLGDQDAIDAAKHRIATSTAYGFELADTTFDQLTDLLSGDYAYSPFKFRNGVRSKDNLINGTKWLVLDIDSSALSASEAHFLLSDINHHIALSSDPSNEFKFRVLLELDAVVELSPTAWKHFYLSIASDLGLKVDPLPQSQIFFSYSGRPILSVTDAEPITTREYIIYAREKEADKQHTTRSLSTAQQAAMLDDWESTFYYAVNAPVGTGSRNMYRMITHAKDLGASLDHIYHLIDNVNELWSMDLGAMHPDRINLLKQQAARLF